MFFIVKEYKPLVNGGRNMSEDELKLEDIKPFFNKMPIVYFATAVKDQPRVRPMALIYNNNKYWLTSRAYEIKMKEIEQNGKMEFSFFVQIEKHNLNIRATGQASVVVDQKVKESAVKAINFFDSYWTGPLISLKIEKVRVADSKTKNRYEFDWQD